VNLKAPIEIVTAGCCLRIYDGTVIGREEINLQLEANVTTWKHFPIVFNAIGNELCQEIIGSAISTREIANKGGLDSLSVWRFV